MSDRQIRNESLGAVRISLIASCLLVVAVGCGHLRPQASSVEKEQNVELTFVQWSDPHLFDGGASRRGEGVEEEKLDNWSALHWAVLQTNRLVTVNHQEISFVVITGDFGLYNLEMPKSDAAKGGRNKIGPIEQDGRCRRDPKEGPGPAIPFDEAVRLTAQEIRALLVKKVYLVPGNNDLCDEDPRNRYRYAAFVSALQHVSREQQNDRKKDLGAASQSVVEDHVWNKAQSLPLTLPVDPPEPPEIVDLTYSTEVEATYDRDKHEKAATRSSYAYKCSDTHTDFPVEKGFCLLGLDSSFFKSHDDPRSSYLGIQEAADRESTKAMNRLDREVQYGGSYLLFTHIPDIEDPHPGRKSDPGSSWLLPSSTREIWKNVLNRSELIGVFAGHFHTPNRKIYPHNFSYVKTLDPAITQKFWLAPALAAKYQTGSPEAETARGIMLYHVAGRDADVKGLAGERVLAVPIWYSQLDSNPNLSLEFYRQIKLGNIYEQAGERLKAENAYRKALDVAAGDQRDIAFRHLEEMSSSWAFYEQWMQIRRGFVEGAVALLLVVFGIIASWVFWRRIPRLQIYPLECPGDAKIPPGHLQQVTEHLLGVMRYRDAKTGSIGSTKLPFVWSGFSTEIGASLEKLVPNQTSGSIKLLLAWLFKPEFTLRGTLAMGTHDSYIILTLARRGEARTWERSATARQTHDALKDMVYAALLHVKNQSS